jgi:UDP-N-acetylmuramoylalanine--D-glutamate ligase
MSAALLSKIVKETCEGVTIIGVTGTRGKSTTTNLIAHVLASNNFRVHVGGNVRGALNLPLLDAIEDGDVVVLELDSWQLQGFRDLSLSPHIAVFTNFLDDHMNYYHNDKEAYFNDKASIYRYQDEYDVLIASFQASEEIRKRDSDKEMIVASQTNIQSTLIGEHNTTLAQLAYEVASQCGIPDESIRDAIKTFVPVEGRLQDLGIHRGVRVINDNNATTEDATIAGIRAVFQTYGKKPIVIVGGADKGLPIESLENILQEETKEVVYLSGTGTSRIQLQKQYEFDHLKECVQKAFELADEGDVILFSPAFASFSKYFNNEYERNDYFVEETKKYV